MYMEWMVNKYGKVYKDGNGVDGMHVWALYTHE